MYAIVYRRSYQLPYRTISTELSPSSCSQMIIYIDKKYDRAFLKVLSLHTEKFSRILTCPNFSIVISIDVTMRKCNTGTSSKSIKSGTYCNRSYSMLYLGKVVVRNRKAISKFDTCLTQFKFNSQNVIENVGGMRFENPRHSQRYLLQYIFRAQTRTTLKRLQEKDLPKY